MMDDLDIYRRNSPGPVCRLTVEQVAEIREVYRRLDNARKDRKRIQRATGLTPDEFWRFATGKRGKKARAA